MGGLPLSGVPQVSGGICLKARPPCSDGGDLERPSAPPAARRPGINSRMLFYVLCCFRHRCDVRHWLPAGPSLELGGLQDRVPQAGRKLSLERTETGLGSEGLVEETFPGKPTWGPIWGRGREGGSFFSLH